MMMSDASAQKLLRRANFGFAPPSAEMMQALATPGFVEANNTYVPPGAAPANSPVATPYAPTADYPSVSSPSNTILLVKTLITAAAIGAVGWIFWTAK